jgi:hypothetical protein
MRVVVVCALCGKVIAKDATPTVRLRAAGSRCKVSGFGHKWVMRDDA